MSRTIEVAGAVFLESYRQCFGALIMHIDLDPQVVMHHCLKPLSTGPGN